MKNVISALVGIIVAFAITMGFEWLGSQIFPLTEGSDPTNMAWLKSNMDKIPIGAMNAVIAAHFLGIMGGMFIAGLTSKVSMVPAYVVGFVMITGTLTNLIMIPHPTWFMIADVIMVFAGFFFGKSLAQRNVFN